MPQDNEAAELLSACSNLEEAKQVAESIISKGRDLIWLQADFASAAMERFGGHGTAKALATVWTCSARWVLMMAAVSQFFWKPDKRNPERHFDWHRAVLEAYRRTKMPIGHLIDACAEMTCAEIRKMGVASAGAAEQATTICPRCGC